MPKMVNNSVVNVPFYQEKRKNSSPNNSSTADANGGAAITTMENNEHLRKIFVGGLSLNTSAAMMRTFFSQFGPVADTVVMRDPISNRSRGFGFVTYADSESVENVQRARPHIIDSKTVDTKRAFPRHEFNKAVGHLSNIKTNKIFLGGLKDCHDEDSLRDYFRKFGNVTSVKVLTDKDSGRKRGFGFLEFEDTASAGRALAQGKHSINMITVEVKKSTQMAESSKRIRLPIGGAAYAGYAPPQPTIMDNFVYSGNYNPYQAQTSLPPSAFFNGWASYVAPTVPSTYPRYPHRPPPVAAYTAQGAAWPHGSWPANNYGPVASWPMKGGPKHGPMMNERPKNEYKSVQAEEATKQKLSKPSSDENAAGDVEKKWLAKEYKVFKPSGKYNFNASQTNHITSLGNDGSTPAYGI